MESRDEAIERVVRKMSIAYHSPLRLLALLPRLVSVVMVYEGSVWAMSTVWQAIKQLCWYFLLVAQPVDAQVLSLYTLTLLLLVSVAVAIFGVITWKMVNLVRWMLYLCVAHGVVRDLKCVTLPSTKLFRRPLASFMNIDQVLDIDVYERIARVLIQSQLDSALLSESDRAIVDSGVPQILTYFSRPRPYGIQADERLPPLERIEHILANVHRPSASPFRTGVRVDDSSSVVPQSVRQAVEHIDALTLEVEALRLTGKRGG